MRKLGYSDSYTDWIRAYYSTISDWDKKITAKAFMIRGDQNHKCTIIVATNKYGMGINNPDIRLVVQWDISTILDAMIQKLSKDGRDGNQSIFILITTKWTNIKDSNELKQRHNKSILQLFNDNRLKAHQLSQFVNINSFFDKELIAKSEGKSDTRNIHKTDLFGY